MFSISKILDSITSFIKNARPPAPQINRFLMACSMIKRPGLSVINSTANIVKTMNMLGIPTGKMPDGSENLLVLYTYAVVSEIFRALKFDASIQVSLVPGSLSSSGPNGVSVNINNGYAVGGML